MTGVTRTWDPVPRREVPLRRDLTLGGVESVDKYDNTTPLVPVRVTYTPGPPISIEDPGTV